MFEEVCDLILPEVPVVNSIFFHVSEREAETLRALIEDLVDGQQFVLSAAGRVQTRIGSRVFRGIFQPYQGVIRAADCVSQIAKQL